MAGTIVAQLGLHGTVNPNDKSLSPEGVVGVAPGASLYVARVLDTKGSGLTSDVVAAIDWCHNTVHAHIASLSLGSPDRDDAEAAVFQKSFEEGMISFAASGNGGDTATTSSRVYPAAYDSVVAVGAVDEASKHPSFSQGGPYLDLVAPGVGIYSSFPQGRSPYANLVSDGVFYNSSALDYVPFEEYEGTLVDCGLGKGLRSCTESAQSASATCEGFVAYVDRGDIKFTDKVKNVRSQGARAVVIGNNNPEDDQALAFTLGNAATWPPVTAVPTTLVPTLKSLVGKSVRVGIRGSDYALSTGTSMATPHAAGVAALVWSANPTLTPTQVVDILQKSAKHLDADGQTTTGRNNVFGYGLVQAKAAVDLARAKN